MLKRVASVTLMLLALSTMTGCATNYQTATSTTPADLQGIKTIYVVKYAKDYKNTDQLIKDYLTRKGYVVTVGPELPLPYPTDVVMTYADSWLWNVTLFMRELTVKIKHADSDETISTADSIHDALTREDADVMVAEVVKNALVGDINMSQ